MALPEDFGKIYGSTSTGGLTPISDVNYAKGWEFVGSTPPTKNDFSYLQNLSDLKSQWLYANKLQRTDPFGDIKSDGESAVSAALSNLGLIDSSGYSGRLIGAPKIITTSGTYTPTAGCKLAIVELVGAGGGGGGCWLADSVGASAGGGGGSGGYSMLIVLNPVTTAVTIGLGGTQGPVSLNATPPDGSPGGDTSFGSLATAKGGFGGLSTAWAVATGSSDTACTDGGGGALSGTGDIALPGNAGYRGQQLTRNGSSGNGAPSKLGSGGFRSRGISGTLSLPKYGGGGIGNYRASNVTYPGTDGANGVCIVWEYF